ncbi:PREDICTED: arginyl-tRNA--protein transferase 1 isoform X2 [Acromyrmex echinatior]|uniref:arginyl-tRNA--protein transferase 1 isoform X2 n=1 Tax=Acromyrmex echinatior TaxID=103372 RepID=UPI000580DB5C|nr:PREDICTED: arginyl-tRNA--protein transferase 1 isoform X2 [Acromyrmex echinatior]
MTGRQSYSIVEYYAEHEGYQCGYCKKPDTNFSHGMWAHSLTVHDYQSLIDRGWRRSGCYCYKPMMNQTCCPQYTIKCEALDFRISKSQKKILKRMTKFLKNELTKDNVGGGTAEDNIDISNEEALNYSKHLKRAQKNESQINVSSVDDEVDERLSINLMKTKTQENSINQFVSNSSQAQLTNANSKNNLHVRNEIVDIVPCKKAKLLRIERKKNKLLAQGKSQSEIESIMRERKQQNFIKTVEELFEEVYTGLKKLEMKLVRVMSDEFLNTLETSANLYKKYQMTIHGDTPEQCDQKAFYNFLVKSPLQQWIPDSGPPHGYGSFHEQYWLDNKLIAVGVIDILPSCISSVYFFYDPTYSQLSLGTFSSLREVHLTRQLNKIANNLKYYYMGYYIHTCQKMRYKARMQPSKLLCPETYVWCDIEPCLAKLDNEKYSRLNDEINAIDENGVVNVEEVLILYKNIAMPYKKYKTLRKTHEEKREVEEYAKFVGMPCARRMLFFRYSRE